MQTKMHMGARWAAKQTLKTVSKLILLCGWHSYYQYGTTHIEAIYQSLLRLLG